MSSATDAPLVETTVPTDGQTPPQPATRPQPTTLAPRRMNDWGGLLLGALTIGGAVATAFTIRGAVPELRELVVPGGLGLLLLGIIVGLILGRSR